MEKIILQHFDTLKEFTDKVGIASSFWRMIRRGERFPSNVTIANMSKALKMAPEQVFKEVNAMQKKNKNKSS